MNALSKNCPNCGSKLIDDAWDIIEETESGYILDGFYAWVCEKRCGYYVRKE